MISAAVPTAMPMALMTEIAWITPSDFLATR